MKKIYEAPGTCISGGIVRTTLCVVPNPFETQGQYVKHIAGSVGFYV